MDKDKLEIWIKELINENKLWKFYKSKYWMQLKDEVLKEQAKEIANKYGLDFLYRDFRIGFREGQAKARELGLYMQKYCGCVFSEEERYSKQIKKDKALV